MELSQKEFSYFKILAKYQVRRLLKLQDECEQVICSGCGDVEKAFRDIDLIDREKELICQILKRG